VHKNSTNATIWTSVAVRLVNHTLILITSFSLKAYATIRHGPTGFKKLVLKPLKSRPLGLFKVYAIAKLAIAVLLAWQAHYAVAIKAIELFLSLVAIFAILYFGLGNNLQKPKL
jgi:hypothetical protein